MYESSNFRTVFGPNPSKWLLNFWWESEEGGGGGLFTIMFKPDVGLLKPKAWRNEL